MGASEHVAEPKLAHCTLSLSCLISPNVSIGLRSGISATPADVRDLVGALMNSRGLIELIALNIGYDLGILSPRIFTMLVIMALVTTGLTGPFLSLAEYLRTKRVLAVGPA
jgi:hypothetical protein